MDISADIRIERPIDEVFSAWAALERMEEFSDLGTRTKVTDGPTGKGTKFHAVDKWPGRKVEFTVEVTDFEPPDRMAASWAEPMVGGWDAIFEEVDGGTRLFFQSNINPTGAMGLLSPLLKPWAARQLKGFMAGFKEWVESGNAAAS